MDLQSLDLNLLVVLHDLLETRNLTRTAARLGRTQPAVSHALKRLRVFFDDELLLRAGNAMVPTAAAEALRGPLGDTLARVDALLGARGAFEPARLERRFLVGSTDFADLVVWPDALPRLRAEAPGVEITTRAAAADVDRAVQEGGLDLALGTNFEPLSGLVVSSFFEERFVCVARRGHPRIPAAGLDLETFLQLEHALVTPRGLPGGIVDDRLARAGRRRRVVLRLPSFLAAAHVVARTELAVTLPSRVAGLLARDLPLALHESPVALPSFSFGVLFSEARKADPAHRWLRETLKAAVTAAPQA
jgi:DNA-binding transcriptional LysR family regulator